MVSGRASREIRQQKVTRRRGEVARDRANRQILRVITALVLVFAVAGTAAIYFLA